MAGFAVHLCQLFKHPQAKVGINVHSQNSQIGYLETDFLQHFTDRSRVECRGSEKEVHNCTHCSTLCVILSYCRHTYMYMCYLLFFFTFYRLMSGTHTPALQHCKMRGNGLQEDPWNCKQFLVLLLVHSLCLYVAKSILYW